MIIRLLHGFPAPISSSTSSSPAGGQRVRKFQVPALNDPVDLCPQRKHRGRQQRGRRAETFLCMPPPVPHWALGASLWGSPLTAPRGWTGTELGAEILAVGERRGDMISPLPETPHFLAFPHCFSF